MIKVLHKAFDLLESVASYQDRVFTLTELSQMIQEKPTTCANIVKTLCERGYLSRVEPKGYTLGPLSQGIDFRSVQDVRLIEAAREEMTELVTHFGASGVLAVLHSGKKKILDDYKSESDLLINRTVRKSQELYTTSTGLVLTAFGKIPEAEKDAIIQTFGSVERYFQIRASIRNKHYIAICLRPRVLEVAAAVFVQDKPCGAIAVYLPAFLVTPEEKEQLIQAVCQAAQKISERMQKNEQKPDSESESMRL